MLDLLDDSGHKTGEVARKSEAHRLGLWHRCFHCWISTPYGPYLFAQRRAAAKETWPGKIDVTAAGHLMAGEGVEDGVREVEEELGLVVAFDDLIPLGTRKVEREIPGIGFDREFQDAFLLVRNLALEVIELQREEVAAIVRLRLEDMDALHGGTVIPTEEWTRDGVNPSWASLSDFIPEEDHYLQRVITAVRTVLEGGIPAPLL